MASMPAQLAGGDDRAFIVLIPARMESTRLPGKPLERIGAWPMVVRVAKQAAKSKAGAVIVATDHADIAQACTDHGVRCVMTRRDHSSGSDRLAEVVEQLQLDDRQIVVNVQGDEPFIPPSLIDATAEVLVSDTAAVMGTAAHAITAEAEYQNPNVVKVVVNGQGQAQYFSRAPIPCFRSAQSLEAAFADVVSHRALGMPLRHIGIYSYRAGFLRQFPSMEPAPTETVESLEQLRVLWHGHRIAVHLSESTPPAGVDTQEDLARAREMVMQQG